MAMLKSVRYGLRMLGKSPLATAVAAVALALGIGANTAIYSLADILLYRPLELPDLDRVVTLIGTQKNNRKSFDQISPADYLDFRRDSGTVEHVGATQNTSLTLTGDGEPEELEGARVSASFFQALGAQPMQGRTFLESEEAAGQDRVAILGYSLWTGRFASDPRILSRTIHLGGQAYRVVGVMPKDFRYPPGVDLWIPLAMNSTEQHLRAAWTLAVVGRLRKGVSLAQANSEFAALAERIAEADPEGHRQRTVRVELLREYVSGNLVVDFMHMLLGSVAFILLIACSNVANLQFARISQRSKEMAIRTALGAGRLRLMRQFLVESVMLGLLGALIGLLLAIWGLDLMQSALPPEVYRYLPGWGRLGVNSHVLAFTLLVAVLAGVVAGIAPAWLGSRADVNETLKESGRGTSSGVRRHRIRNVLVVGQIVLALVLMVGAGLIGKGTRLIEDPAPGIDPSKALSMRIVLPLTKYPSEMDASRFQQRLVHSLAAVNGVTAAAVASNLPYSGNSSGATITIEGRDARARGTPPSAIYECISTDYFRALHLPVLAGRTFSEQDGREAPLAAIISESFARQHFPGESAIGKRVKIGLPSSDSPWMTIVGVAANVRAFPFDKFFRPVLYRPYQQRALRSFDVLVRTSGDPKALRAAVRAQVTGIDPDQPVSAFKTLDALFDDQLSGFRFLAVLMGVFGFIALLLASIGVYAVMAYSVSERTHEIGVRMALGARQPDVVWMIVRRGLALTGSGLLIGLPATLALARLLANILYGVSEYDPATFGTGLVVLAGAAFLASYIPARRATRVDPIITLRTE